MNKLSYQHCINKLMRLGTFNWMSDKHYIEFMYKVYFGKKLNLICPSGFNEKMQWLKLNEIHTEYSKYVDKYAVRFFIEKELGSRFLVPLLGLWENPEQIEFNELPDRFVLKCTHNSGHVIICNDKKNFDKEAAKKSLRRSLHTEYYKRGREYPYKYVKPQIIGEEYLDDGTGQLPRDYKILCFNGEPQNIMVCKNRNKGHAEYYFFDFNWNFLPLNIGDEKLPPDFTLPKPDHIKEMYLIAKKLARQFIVSRIDLYEIKGKIYFGEITLFPASGFDREISESTDEMFGKRIKLPGIE